MSKYIMMVALVGLVGCGGPDQIDPCDAGPEWAHLCGTGGEGGEGGAGGGVSEPPTLGILVECDETATVTAGTTTYTVTFAWLPVADVTSVTTTRCRSYQTINEVSYPQPWELGGAECYTSHGASFTGNDVYIECSRLTVSGDNTNLYGNESIYYKVD